MLKGETFHLELFLFFVVLFREEMHNIKLNAHESLLEAQMIKKKPNTLQISREYVKLCFYLFNDSVLLQTKSIRTGHKAK